MLRHKNALIILLLVALVFLLFGKTLENGFNSDDYLVIYYASHSSHSVAAELSQFFKPSWQLYYRPLITAFFDILQGRFGLAPMGYHLVSLLFYAALCIEVYFLGVLLTRRALIGLAAALIFMTMTAHAQAIFWISSLNGVVENVFSLASVLLFILWRERTQRTFYALSLVFFLVALFLKESAVAVAAVVILFDAFLGGEFKWPQSATRTAGSTWPFILFAVLFVALRGIIMRQLQLPPPLTSFTWSTSILGFWHTLLMTLSPIDWALSVRWFNSLQAGGVFFSIAALLVLLAIAIVPLLLKKLRVLFLLGWLAAGAVPVILLGLVPSERHVVFSSAAAAVLIALFVFAIGDAVAKRISMPVWAPAGILALAFCATSFFFLNERRITWKVASDITGSVIAQTVAAYPAPEPNTTLFFLNVPDTYDGALVFRFDNLRYALRLFYNQDSLDAVRIITPDRITAGIVSDPTYAYFRISAMGGNIFSRGGEAPSGNLERLAFLSRNSSYLNDWPRYSNSPFLIYSGGRIIPSSPEELRNVLEGLYSVN